MEYPVKMKKSSNISVTAFHRFIPQPASGRSSALPSLAASLVWSEFWRLLHLHGLIFRTRRHSRLLSNINHTLKHRFSRHINKAVLKPCSFLHITSEDSSLIFLISPFPQFHLPVYRIIDTLFEVIKVLLDLALIDEPTKSVEIVTC